MRPPHVAVVTTLAEIGGAERSLVELVRRLRGVLRFTLVVPGDGRLVTAAVEAGAEACVLDWPAGFASLGERSAGWRSGVAVARAAAALPALVARLRARLSAIEPDVVLTNGIKAHVLGALAQRPGGPALVWYGREGLEDRPWSRRALGAVARRCDGAIAVSRYVARELRRVLPERTPVEVVYNVVDPQTFRAGLPAPADLPRTAGEIRFGVVGALTPLKGQDVFVRAAARVARELPAARFLVVGGNPYRTGVGSGYAARLRAEVEALGLGGRVRFLGERADVAAIVSSLDVLVQPNRGPEGLGRTVLEAMACGVSVVAVDRWGPGEIVQDGETGLLVPPLDEAALAERMVRLGRDPALRGRLGAQGRRWIGAHGDPERLARAFRHALDGLIARADRPAGPVVQESSGLGR